MAAVPRMRAAARIGQIPDLQRIASREDLGDLTGRTLDRPYERLRPIAGLLSRTQPLVTLALVI